MNRNLEKVNVPTEIINLLSDLKKELVDSFKANILSIYLHGSITTGDFRGESSDIDYLVVIGKEFSSDEVELLSKIHKKLIAKHEYLGRKLEGSYLLESELKNIEPPIRERLYFNDEYLRYEKYGSEWIFEQYSLSKFGVELYELNKSRIFTQVPEDNIKKASINLLMNEWKPRVENSEYIWTNEYLAYGVLTVCRIIYSLETGKMKSKTGSARYVLDKYDGKYIKAIEESLKWKIDDNFKAKDEAINFIADMINNYK